ncbi:MAG: hypothetical protein JHC33_13800 [Ignisphaera sp.]|nr:hypothetical protein [Ignisphaera sp.]
MAYICSAGTNLITAIDIKLPIMPFLNVAQIGVIVNKNIFTQSNINNTVALMTKTVTEPGITTAPPFASKTIFNPIMTPGISSITRPLTGQFWPRNITTRNIITTQPNVATTIYTYAAYGGF